jgi:predicted NACHT family NTPase
MVLGKPGAGKTTFLQWIAIKCNLGEFQPNRVPVFIRLKDFADYLSRDDGKFRLFHYISEEEFASCGITDKSVLEKILTNGQALILLDGLDEVSEEDDKAVIIQIHDFVNKYFKNQFIITCRIAASGYKFQGFTDVEITDFNNKQVTAFAKKWFTAVARINWREGEAIAKQFIEELKQKENKQIRELAVTPILLNLTCIVFHAKGSFPSKRAKLYEQGLEILLNKWDESRGIKRHDIYGNLSLEHKIELLIQIAANTFENTRLFFEQGELEQYIADYLRTLPDTKNGRLMLQRYSKSVLHSIEAQHGLLVARARGIYSFSHLTFQEYFTALAVINSSSTKTKENFFGNFVKKSWYEVFLLASCMIQTADKLLLKMKYNIDLIMAENEKLQQFIDSANRKAFLTNLPYKRAAICAYYFAVELIF